MSLEDDFAARMTGDAILMAILTGGVYKSGTVGDEGITRESAPTAFDGDGYLEPCALVKQRGNVPDGQVLDDDLQLASASQVVEVWLYQDTGYTALDAARARLWTLFQGKTIGSNGFEAHLVFVVDREHDRGALGSASLMRLDWQVVNIIQ